MFVEKECKKGASVCHASEYCCPDAKKCLTPSNRTCAKDTSNCEADEVCCPLTKLCVKPGASCKSPCPAQGISDEGSYCCPEARKCMTPVDAGTLCDPSDKHACKTTLKPEAEQPICCPLTKECVEPGQACVPP